MPVKSQQALSVIHMKEKSIVPLKVMEKSCQYSKQQNQNIKITEVDQNEYLKSSTKYILWTICRQKNIGNEIKMPAWSAFQKQISQEEKVTANVLLNRLHESI